MNILSRKQAPMTQPQQSVNPEHMDPDAAKLFDSFVTTRKERDAALHEVERLRADQAVNIRHIEQLEQMLEKASNDRDFWMAHATFLKTRLGDIDAMIDNNANAVNALIKNALEEARTAGRVPPSTTTPEQRQQIDDSAAKMASAIINANPDNKWG